MQEAIERSEQVVEAVQAIAGVGLGDGLEFDLDSLTTRALTEAAEGLGVGMVAWFGESRQTVHMDISSGNAITPGPAELAFPALLGGRPHPLLAYPLETVVAEKYAAAVELGAGNTRLKDFYDLWYILGRSQLSPQTLRLAVERTFAARGTALEGSQDKWAALVESQALARLWGQFLGKGRLEAPADFALVAREIADRLEEALSLPLEDEG